MVALALVVAGASGAVTYLLRRNDDDRATPAPVTTTRAREKHPATTSTTSTTSSTTSTTTSTLPFGVAPAPLAPVLGTVARTCGAGGSGDCFLSLRTAPTGSAPEVQRLPDGAPIFISCQVVGEPVTSSVLHRTSTAWTRTPDGKYAASVYIDAVGFDPLSVSVPCP